MIRLFVTDDHALVREGLKRMLAATDDISIIGEASTGADAVNAISATEPDVLLLDLSMPGKDGIETTTEVSKLDVATRILILTMHSDEQYALRSIQAGASGFIDKGARVGELCHAIREVHAGRRYLPSHLRELITRDPDGGRAPVDSLSRREFQVMCFLASGLTNREIADQLTISSKTVDTHRGNVLKKLRLRNNSDITRFAVRNGYIFA